MLSLTRIASNASSFMRIFSSSSSSTQASLHSNSVIKQAADACIKTVDMYDIFADAHEHFFAISDQYDFFADALHLFDQPPPYYSALVHHWCKATSMYELNADGSKHQSTRWTQSADELTGSIMMDTATEVPVESMEDKKPLSYYRGVLCSASKDRLALQTLADPIINDTDVDGDIPSSFISVSLDLDAKQSAAQSKHTLADSQGLLDDPYDPTLSLLDIYGRPRSISHASLMNSEPTVMATDTPLDECLPNAKEKQSLAISRKQRAKKLSNLKLGLHTKDLIKDYLFLINNDLLGHREECVPKSGPLKFLPKWCKRLSRIENQEPQSKKQQAQEYLDRFVKYTYGGFRRRKCQRRWHFQVAHAEMILLHRLWFDRELSILNGYYSHDEPTERHWKMYQQILDGKRVVFNSTASVDLEMMVRLFYKSHATGQENCLYEEWEKYVNFETEKCPDSVHLLHHVGQFSVLAALIHAVDDYVYPLRKNEDGSIEFAPSVNLAHVAMDLLVYVNMCGMASGVYDSMKDLNQFFGKTCEQGMDLHELLEHELGNVFGFNLNCKLHFFILH